MKESTDEKKRISAVNEVSKKYNFSYQRVHNWTIRGVPYKIQVLYPEIKKMLEG